MTDPVVADNTRRVRYKVTNPMGQDTFVITFPVVTLDDGVTVTYGISLTVDDAIVDSTDYTVDLDAGTVVLDTPAAQNAVVVLEGSTPAIRLIGYALRGGPPSARLNQEFNSLYYLVQELVRDSLRSLVLPKSAGDDVSSALPTPVASQLLGWASDAKSLQNYTVADIDPAIVSAFIATLLDASDASAAQTVLGISTFIKTLLNDADASTALSTLGISAFIKTLLDDADASTALSTLGISAFIKTLLDNADASTALSTLGISAFIKTLLSAASASAARSTLGAAASGANTDITALSGAALIVTPLGVGAQIFAQPNQGGQTVPIAAGATLAASKLNPVTLGLAGASTSIVSSGDSLTGIWQTMITCTANPAWVGKFQRIS